MTMNIHDWMDNWFLSLPENPGKLDKAIRNFETGRLICLICFVVVLVMYLIVVFKSNNQEVYGFMFSLIIFVMVMTIQNDFFVKILKLQRRNIENNKLDNN